MANTTLQNNQNQHTTSVMPIFLAFLCMGFGDVAGPMVSMVKETFNLSNLMAQSVSFAGFVMFGLLSVPMGLLQDKKGKKYILSLGLLVALLGLLVPIVVGLYGSKVTIDASSQWKFYPLLLAILFLGAGNTILQVAGNPIMRDVSAPGKYASNLSLGQTIKAIGSSMGFLIPPFVAIPLGLDWTMLFPIFSAMLLISLLWVKTTPIYEKKEADAKVASLSSCLKLMGNGWVALMVFGIFAYVGAEVSMSSGVPTLLKEKYGFDQFGLFISWLLFFLPILIGRFSGSLLLRFLSAKSFLIVTVLTSLVGILALLSGILSLTFVGIVLVGLGFANIFPLIFAITVDSMPDRTNELSGLMVTAIVGGAILPLFSGWFADITGSAIALFFVPLACLIYLSVVGVVALRKK